MSKQSSGIADFDHAEPDDLLRATWTERTLSLAFWSWHCCKPHKLGISSRHLFAARAIGSRRLAAIHDPPTSDTWAVVPCRKSGKSHHHGSPIDRTATIEQDEIPVESFGRHDIFKVFTRSEDQRSVLTRDIDIVNVRGRR